MRCRTLLVLSALLVGACSSPVGPVATVNGTEITAAELAALHPEGASLDNDERAGSLYLLVLNRLLTAAAEEDFSFEISAADRDAAFKNRTGGLGDGIDATLAGRGVTQARVMLEAELDLVRENLEEKIVHEGGFGFDFDRAYRGFLGVNSRVCMVVLSLADASLVDDIQSRVDAGEDLDAIFDVYPDRTARIDMGCLSPVEHGQQLAPVALDGEVGKSYARQSGDGAIFVAKVTERDAPSAEEVREEVLAYGVESQGPAVFDAWAVSILQAAEVGVDPDIGVWGPGPDTGDVPTIVPS